MAGQLFRAVQRTGGLQPIIDTYKDIYEKNRRRQALQDFAKQYQSAMGQIGQINNATNTTYQPTEEKINLFPNETNPIVSEMLNKSVNPAPARINMLGSKETTPVSDTEKYNRAEKVQNDFITQMFGNPDFERLNPSVINTLSGMLGNKVNELRPTINWETLSEGSKKIGTDKYGNVKKEIYNPKVPQVPLVNPETSRHNKETERIAAIRAKIEAQKANKDNTKAPDVSKEEGSITELEDQLNNIDFSLNQKDKENKPINQNDDGTWNLYNPITRKTEEMDNSSVRQLKSELQARLNKAKSMRQSKVDRVYGSKNKSNKKSLPTIKY
jgi:hypothetical protein